MDSLPVDVLPIVFSYLDAAACMRCRLVCQRWQRISGKGCVLLALKYYALPPDGRRPVLGGVTLMGSGEDWAGAETINFRSLKRTRGHLPEPRVLFEGQEVTPLTVLSRLARFDNRFSHVLSDAVPTKERGFAVKIEREGGQTQLISLDMEASTFEVAWRACAGQRWINGVPHPGPLFDRIDEKPRKLKKALEWLNLTGLQHLQRLSVRGCSSLWKMFLPPGLVALDASGCTSLRLISVPEGVKDDGLIALNLSGCRSLEPRGEEMFGPWTEQAMKSVKEVDLSAVNRSLAPALASALRVTTCLETLSLRYVATDDILLALSESESARETLRLLDVAFSTELTDVAVEALVQSAPNLERFNLRGCRGISIECYNKIPVLLMNRQSGYTSHDRESEPSTADRKARKGDNIFSFVASGVKASKRAKLA